MITTSSILDTVLEYLSQGMKVIYRNYWLTIAGCFIFSLFLSLLLVRKLQKNSYIFKQGTPKVYHFLHAIALPAFCGFVIWRVKAGGFLFIACSALVCALSLFADYEILRFKWRGVVLADIAWILSTVIYNVWIYGMIGRTFGEIMEYSAAGIYSLLASSDMWMFRGWLMCLITAVLIVANAGYYARRYYLFFPGEIKGMGRCEKCGHPIFKGDAYCPSCGTKAEPAEIECPDNYNLADPVYCPKCGSRLIRGKCIRCGFEIDEGSAIEDAFNNIGEGSWKMFIYLMILVVIFVPAFFNKADWIATGSTQANNEYIALIDEYTEDHSVAENEDWLTEYDLKYQALMKANTKWIDVPYKIINRNNLVYYIFYSEAAFSQCEVMEEINDEIYMSAAGEEIIEEALDSQLKYYDLCIEDMADAVFAGYSSTSRDNVVRKLIDYTVNGLRYWYSKLPDYTLSIVLTAAGLFSCIWLALDLGRDEELRKIRFGKRLSAWLSTLIKADTKEGFVLKKEIRRDRANQVVAAYIAAFVLIAVCFGLTFIIKDDDDRINDYMAE